MVSPPPHAPMHDVRPPGAPRKQQSQLGAVLPTGPVDDLSRSTSSNASSSSGSAMRHDVSAAYDVASSLFNDSLPGPSMAVAGALQQVREAPSWLSRRMLPPMPNEIDPPHSTHTDTPTGRYQYANGANGTAEGSNPNGDSAFRTPSATLPPSTALYEQLARGMAASRRQHSYARASLASSSGWGSPRVNAPSAILRQGQRLSESDSSSAAPSQLSSHNEANVFGVPRTPSSANMSDVPLHLRPPGVPRFSFPFNSASHLAGGINQDGSYNVARDGEDANNSGLLALSPAIRRINGYGTTSLHQRISKVSDPPLLTGSIKPISETASSTSSSDRQGSNATIIEHALEVEGMQPHYDDEMEIRRAQLLQNGTRAGPEEHGALLEVMRNWREDAMKHHLYDTAIFWGDKILSLETDQVAWNDAYNLATAYFLTHRYAQAEHLLCTPLRLASTAKTAAPADEQHESVARDNSTAHAQGERDDELGAALAATHRTSKLPPAMLARAHANAGRRLSNPATSFDDEDEAMIDVQTEDGPQLKRKQRPFTVSGTGTASEGTSAGGASTAGDLNGEGERIDGDENGPTERDDRKEQAKMTEKVAQAWREEQKLAMDEVRDSGMLPPDSVSLVSVSIPCKYLAAQCMVRQGKYQEALDELSGWKGDTDEQWAQNYRQPSRDGLIKLSSSIWHLKGLIQLHLRNTDEARESFMRSLSLDVKNYESFDQLIRGHLLTAGQQWDFVESLEYAAQAGHDAAQVEALQVVRLLYLARLDKSGKLHAQQAAAARRQLVGVYGLGQSPDVLLGLAEEMFTRMRYEDAYAVTKRIMELSCDHEAALPIHISSMYVVERLRPSLFLLAHRLTDKDPDLAAGWYAVGCWYFASQRWLEARKHFSKSVQIDPRFAPGWIAFAHTFAHEGESDQAVVSYSTAERSFSAHFLVKLFLGMEHLAQGNLTLADLYLCGSAEVWEEDALSRNERGVTAYYAGRLDDAIVLFRAALQAAKDVQQPPSAWTATHLNLGFALRRTGQLDAARRSFLRVLELDPDVAAAYTGVAMCYHGEGEVDEAITWYHRALAVDSTDKHANDLLSFALQESAQYAPHALMAAADRVIEEEVNRRAQDQPQYRGSVVPDGSTSPASRDAFGIRIEEGDRTSASYTGNSDGTREMTLADGTLSLEMEESE